MPGTQLPGIENILGNLITAPSYAVRDKPKIAAQAPNPTLPTASGSDGEIDASRPNFGARRGRPMGAASCSGSDKEKVSFRIPGDLLAQYRDWSWEARCSLSTLAEKAMAEYLQRRL